MGICVRNIVPEYPVNEKTIYFPEIEMVKYMKMVSLSMKVNIFKAKDIIQISGMLMDMEKLTMIMVN